MEPQRWLQRHNELGKNTPIRPYRMTDRYRRGEVSENPTVGGGCVGKRREDQRMDVRCKGSLKRMVMSLPAK